MNDATIIAALLPIVGGKTVDDPEGFETAVTEYLARYADHLKSLDHRDFVAALNQATKIAQARMGGD
ncbi:MAG: hypothetical protein M0T84_07035 [Betaproteobacteria bacterium]|nr:hypothetical protein [Betaproteobacteria bacterium]